MASNRRLVYGGLGILLIVLILGVVYSNIQEKKNQKNQYKFPSPENVVQQYFTAWNEKNYPDMYATLSDGFKKIDPNARDLKTFQYYASSQGIEAVEILTIKEKSNDGHTASVVYSVEFTLRDQSKQSAHGAFTLKYRPGDVIQGWKLIHPYGENIDGS